MIRSNQTARAKQKGTPEGVWLSAGLRRRGFWQFFELLDIIIFLLFVGAKEKTHKILTALLVTLWKIYTN